MPVSSLAEGSYGLVGVGVVADPIQLHPEPQVGNLNAVKKKVTYFLESNEFMNGRFLKIQGHYEMLLDQDPPCLHDVNKKTFFLPLEKSMVLRKCSGRGQECPVGWH